MNGQVTEYQRTLKLSLDHIFNPDIVRVEWSAMRDEPRIYSPRLDLAVGPFATHRRYIEEYNNLSISHSALLRALYVRHLENVEEGDSDRFNFESVINRNFNARCFLAIEIENQVSHKHLMGGAINAAALGRIGLAVAWSADNLRKFVRMRNYMLFLSDVEKNTFDTSNLLVLTAEQLLEIINDYAS